MTLCNLLHSIKNHVTNDEYLKKFDIKRNALSTIGLSALNERFFIQVNNILKKFLMSVMFEKQRA